ncbi:MAG: sulfite exporter TauE/SafE family protein [Elusimicrobiaceae bacterium]|nr:sulfite exporter TauE/SafE family protein [Elusimicrobiaceae bacterium]
MAWYTYLVFPIIGFIGMMCGGFWSVGCGWLIVPTLLIFGFEPLEAVGAALLQMVFSTAPTVIKEFSSNSWGKKSIMRALALPMALGVILTAFSGRLINNSLSEKFGSKALLALFAFVMLFIGLKSLLGKTAKNQNEIPQFTKLQSFIALLCGMMTGIISSLLGISGALIFRPVIINGFKVPEIYATKAIRFLLLTASFSGSMFYLFAEGNFHQHILLLGALIALGGAFGFPIGVRYGRTVVQNGYTKILQKSFGSIVLIIITNTVLNLLGFVTFSRYLMIACAFALFMLIKVFTVYTKKHPLLLKNQKGGANN